MTHQREYHSENIYVVTMYKRVLAAKHTCHYKPQHGT